MIEIDMSNKNITSEELSERKMMRALQITILKMAMVLLFILHISLQISKYTLY